MGLLDWFRKKQVVYQLANYEVLLSDAKRKISSKELTEKIVFENPKGVIRELSDCCSAPIVPTGKGVILYNCSKCGENYFPEVYRK